MAYVAIEFGKDSLNNGKTSAIFIVCLSELPHISEVLKMQGYEMQ